MRQKLIQLDVNFQGRKYALHSFWGFLYSTSNREIDLNKYSRKVRNVLSFVNSPYSVQLAQQLESKGKKRTKLFASFLTILTKLNFKLGINLAKFNLCRFDNSTEAISFYRKNIKPNNQTDLCMARCLFAASTSKLFREKGAILIGVFLPTNSLHSWIIEEGKIADPNDNIWINYQPIAMIVYD